MLVIPIEEMDEARKKRIYGLMEARDIALNAEDDRLTNTERVRFARARKNAKEGVFRMVERVEMRSRLAVWLES